MYGPTGRKKERKRGGREDRWTYGRREGERERNDGRQEGKKDEEIIFLNQ